MLRSWSAEPGACIGCSPKGHQCRDAGRIRDGGRVSRSVRPKDLSSARASADGGAPDELLAIQSLQVSQVYSAVPDGRESGERNGLQRDGSADARAHLPAGRLVGSGLAVDEIAGSQRARASPLGPCRSPCIRCGDRSAPEASAEPPPSWAKVLAATLGLWTSRHLPWLRRFSRRRLAAVALGAGLVAVAVGTTGLAAAAVSPEHSVHLPARPSPIPAPSARTVLPAIVDNGPAGRAAGLAERSGDRGADLAG